jgi:phosphoribosylamine--glycine ligase
MRVLLVGGGGREHAIASSLCRNSGTRLYAISSNDNPGIESLSVEFSLHRETDIDWIVDWARSRRIDFAVVGFEDPLVLGISDALEAARIPCLGPKRAAAELEGSKEFARSIMKKHRVPGYVEYECFDDPQAVTDYLLASKGEFAVKPIGLTAGKGVKVMGDQLESTEEAIAYASEIITNKVGGESKVLLEERLEGEEFTLQCFVDGKTVVPMPAVQDYKRAFEGNVGPNTGGMGSYSQHDGLFPFLSKNDFNRAVGTIEATVGALRSEGIEYQGILYGQFMQTQKGPRIVEFNARFGDPEGMNVLSVLQSDLLKICEAIINRSLADVQVHFDKKATVCKYVVPPNYGVAPRADVRLEIDRKKLTHPGIRLYYAKVKKLAGDAVATTTSRSLGVVGVADSVLAAEALAEEALTSISGEYRVRHDIGRIPSSRSVSI